MAVFFVNGAFVPEDQAFIHARDLAVLRGYGAFDFLRTYGGHPFRLDQNIARLRQSCAKIELEIPWSDVEIEAIVLETLAHNQGLSAEFNIRLVVTGGVSGDNITPDGEPSLLVMVQPLKQPPQWWYEKGVKVITVDLNRLLPDAKSIMYTPAIIAQKRARKQGAIEALYLDGDGFVSEGTTTNIFAVREGVIITPPVDGTILAGITRKTVLELAASDYPLEIRPLAYDDVITADELFITAANKQVVPVVQIDDHLVGTGEVGAITQQIMGLFHALTERRAQGMTIHG